MKHLKRFETALGGFNEGDYVVLLKNKKNIDYIISGSKFNVGEIYIIMGIDIVDDEIKIAYIDDIFIDTWVRPSYIRKATQEEIDQNKYNL